ESSRLLALLVRHPSMEPSQRPEEQNEAEEDQAGQEPADADHVGGRGRPRRRGQDEQEQSDEAEIGEGKGERQRAERLQAQKRILVVRAQRERGLSESMDAERNAPERPDDRGQR